MVVYNRDLIGVYMDWLVNAKTKIGYRQLRPMTTSPIDTAAELKAAIKRGFEMDCSESVTLLCHLAGLRPPSGAADGYSYGNTETLLANLPHLGGPAQAKLGDLAVFNADLPLSKQHVGAVRHPGENPTLFTHGTEADPSFYKLSQMQPGFPGRTIFLSLGRL